MDKKEIRQYMIQKRLDLDTAWYASTSAFIMYMVESLPCFQKAKTVGVYVATRQEVNTRPFIEKWGSKKQICVPKVKGKTMDFHRISSLQQLHKGTFGVMEPQFDHPIPKKTIELLLVPVVAFDEDCNRIGYGGGYFDRFLADFSGDTIGIAFSFQQIENIRKEPHDIRLDRIIHEEL